MQNVTNIKTEQIGADLSKVVDRISKQYDRPDIALQKEAIQNSWDVREDKREGNEWLLKIYEQRTMDGNTHIVVEDFGTKGMNEKRWEGFTSLWRPEKEYSDAGGKGQGKFVLMSASSSHILFVESMSDDTGYQCKFLQNENKSNETISIQDYIPNVQPLDHKGTKIWVYKVSDEFLTTLHSEEFIESIIESWWQILGERFNVKINIFGKEVVPQQLSLPTEEVVLFENYPVNDFGRIKRLRLGFYDKKIPSVFDGVRVQRANMMIVKIPFEIHNKDYQRRFSGYIEFDKTLERELKEIEKNDHCNFTYDSPWKEIKNLIKEEIDKFIARIVPSSEQRKEINIDEYCPEILGGGTVMPAITRKSKPPTRITHITLNKREVRWNDTVKCSCGVLNTTEEYKKIELIIEIKKSGTKISEEEYVFKIQPGESKTIKLSEIKLEKNKFDKGKYIVRGTLRNEERHDLDTKSTSFYLETKREPTKRGYIKEIRFYESEEPVRNKPVRSGILSINLGHKEFSNIWSLFEEKPLIQSKQIGYYIMKLGLDEAVRELLKAKLKDSNLQDPDDAVQDIKDIQDRMYYDVYA
jgi:hypothetical protein